MSNKFIITVLFSALLSTTALATDIKTRASNNANKRLGLKQRVTNAVTDIETNTQKNTEQDTAIATLAARVSSLESGTGGLEFIPGGNYVKQDLSGMDLSNLDLTMANLSFSNLTNTDFSDTDLTAANLYKVIADGADFTTATINAGHYNRIIDGREPQTSFLGASLLGASFAGQTLITTAFSKADITNADFSNTVLSGPFFVMQDNENIFGTAGEDLSNLPVLSGINLSGSDLRRVTFIFGLVSSIGIGDGSSSVFSPSIIVDNANFSNAIFNSISDGSLEGDVIGIGVGAFSNNFSQIYFKNTTFLGATGGSDALVRGEGLTCPDGTTGQTSCFLNL